MKRYYASQIITANQMPFESEIRLKLKQSALAKAGALFVTDEWYKVKISVQDERMSFGKRITFMVDVE